MAKMNVTTLATSQPSRISPSAARVLIDIWITFQTVGGHFLTPILIATFLFSKAKRDSTLINLGLTFVLTSVFNCLLSVVLVLDFVSDSLPIF